MRDKSWRVAIDEFVDEVKKFDIDKIILYGSAARGEYVPEKSDIDILIVGDKQIREKVVDIEFDIGLERNVLITTIIKSSQKFKQELEWGSPFLENVMEDGKVIYERSSGKRVGAG